VPYKIVFLSRADEDFNRIATGNPIAASKLLDKLDEIAVNPGIHDKPGGMPYPPYPQFRIWLPADNQEDKLYIVVLFTYSLDENTIEIRALASTVVGPDYPFGP
jgi:hypothetical protein